MADGVLVSPGFVPAHELDVVMHICNSVSGKMLKGEREVQGHALLYSKF